MANRKFPYTEQLPPFQAADDAWSAELHRVFGKNACNARYLLCGRGEEGTKLRELYEAREAARSAWHASAA